MTRPKTAAKTEAPGAKVKTPHAVLVTKSDDGAIGYHMIGDHRVEKVMVYGNVVPVVPFRTELLIEKVGSVTAAADLLGVSKSQPTRWRKGEAIPSPEKARLLNDLEHVFSRAAMIFETPVIKEWMFGSNDFLEGARPIDVLKTRGVSEVLDALDAAEQIAYGG